MNSTPINSSGVPCVSVGHFCHEHNLAGILYNNIPCISLSVMTELDTISRVQKTPACNHAAAETPMSETPFGSLLVFMTKRVRGEKEKVFLLCYSVSPSVTQVRSGTSEISLLRKLQTGTCGLGETFSDSLILPTMKSQCWLTTVKGHRSFEFDDVTSMTVSITFTAAGCVLSRVSLPKLKSSSDTR